MNYYIIDKDDNTQGPFDLIVIVRRVRNKQISLDTLIMVEGEESPKLASDIEEIRSLFDMEEVRSNAAPASPYRKSAPSYGRGMAKGWKFLQTHQLSMLYAAGFVVISLLAARLLFMPSGYSFVTGFITFFISYFTLSVVSLGILRLNRGQPLSLGFLIGKMTASFVPLFLQTAIVTGICLLLPIVGKILFNTNVVVTLALFIPATFVLPLLIFMPFFISDQKRGVLPALNASIKLATQQGTASYGVVFALVMTNIIFLFPIISLVVLIPITFSALAEIYEDSNSL